MAEYIDREKLIAEYDRVHIGEPGGARKLMVEAPAVDVVEVVRCKECFYNKHGGCTKSEDYDSNEYRPDYYCADGLREEGAEE